MIRTCIVIACIVLGVQFSSDEYNIKENEGQIIIEIHRLTHKTYTDTYHFNTIEQLDQPCEN